MGGALPSAPVLKKSMVQGALRKPNRVTEPSLGIQRSLPQVTFKMTSEEEEQLDTRIWGILSLVGEDSTREDTEGN